MFGDKARLSVTVIVASPDKRRRDVDNLCKSLLDALEHAGVYEDDCQIDQLLILRDPEAIIKGGLVKVQIAKIERSLMGNVLDWFKGFVSNENTAAD